MCICNTEVDSIVKVANFPQLLPDHVPAFSCNFLANGYRIVTFMSLITSPKDILVWAQCG